MPSSRIQQIDPSGIRTAFSLAAKLHNPCNLSIGQPHFGTPEQVKQALIEACHREQNGYTRSEGLVELQQAVLKRYADKGASQESAFITSAVSGGFLLALIATCDVGDELIIPDPYFVMWHDLANVFGVKPALVDTYPDFRWTREKLEAAITPKSKAIALCSPANPTGAVVTEEELQMIADVARTHNLWVIYDEIYEPFCYEGSHLDMSRYYDKTITLSGFSKSHSMTGWRVGSAVGPQEIIEQMVKLQQYSFVCAPSLSQWGAIEALNIDISDRVAEYKAKRDYMVEALSGAYEIASPEGAFYLFPRVPGGMNCDDFCKKAAEEEELIVVSGSAFSPQKTHFRLSYAASDETLQRGVDILLRLAK